MKAARWVPESATTGLPSVPFHPPLSRDAAREVVAVYGTWPLVQVDVPLIVRASRLDEQDPPCSRSP